MAEPKLLVTEQSTEQVDPTDRVGFWGIEVGSRQCSVGFRPGTRDYNHFVGRTKAMRYTDGSLLNQLVEFESLAVQYERRWNQLGDDTDKRALIPLQGSVILTQEDREAVLLPGQLGMITMAKPMALAHDDGTCALIATIPGEAITDLTDTTPIALNPKDGAIEAAIAMARALSDIGETCSDEVFARVFKSMTELLASSVDPQQEPEMAEYARVYRQAREYVERNYVDPRVTARSIAEHLNWSPRRLAYALQRMGDSPGRLLRHTRLAQASQLLRQSQPALPVNEIVFRCGFGSANGFREAWRLRYGMSYAEWRERGLTGQGWSEPVEPTNQLPR